MVRKEALSKDQKNKIRTLYKTDKYTIEELANIYDVWPTTIARLTRDIDLPRKHKKKVSLEDHNEMIKLYNKGMGYREIGQNLGYSYGTVRRHILKEFE